MLLRYGRGDVKFLGIVIRMVIPVLDNEAAAVDCSCWFAGSMIGLVNWIVLGENDGFPPVFVSYIFTVIEQIHWRAQIFL